MKAHQAAALHEFAQTDKLSALEFRIEPDEAAEAPPAGS